MTKGERLAKSPATQRLVPLVCTPQDITGYFSTGRSSLPCKDGAGSLIHSWRRPGKGRRAGNPGRTGLLQLGEGRATGQAEPSSPGTPCTPCRLSLEDDSRRVSPKASGFQSHRGGLADRRGGALRDGSAAHFRPTLPSRMEEAPRPRGRLSRRRPPPGAGSPSHHSWFLLEGSENKPWAALLRMALDSQPLPPFPAFPDQDPSPDPEPTVPPEVFTVGPKVFSWTPFPSALEFSGSSYHLFHGAGDPMWSPTRPLKEHPAPEPCGTLSTQELLPVQSPPGPCGSSNTRELLSARGPPALQSCPMCQQEFPPTLTQLDVDSHLAQCLAESTEDIVW